MIPGLSLLLKVIGLSIEPVAKITFFALIFQTTCLIEFVLSTPCLVQDLELLINNYSACRQRVLCLL